MAFPILIFVSALSISAVAAYFSIIGLATIFPGSVTSVIVMGSALEVGKLVAAVWVHKHWKNSPFYLKAYLIPAVLILSLITSMGIFGFLSKSHVEHEYLFSEDSAKVERIDERISTLESRLASKSEELKRMEGKGVDLSSNRKEVIQSYNSRISEFKLERDRLIQTQQSLIESEENKIKLMDEEILKLKSSSAFGASSKLKKLQADQLDKRKEIDSRIFLINENINLIEAEFGQKISVLMDKIDNLEESKLLDSPKGDTELSDSILLSMDQLQENIDLLRSEKFNFSSNLRAMEAEVGPIKYIGALFEDSTGYKIDNEQAVRAVILILIFVFDPLAILLLISATISLAKAREGRLPPDVALIRKDLLQEVDDFISEGGSIQHYLDRHSR
jgi:hypothetical protein